MTRLIYYQSNQVIRLPCSRFSAMSTTVLFASQCSVYYSLVCGSILCLRLSFSQVNAMSSLVPGALQCLRLSCSQVNAASTADLFADQWTALFPGQYMSAAVLFAGHCSVYSYRVCGPMQCLRLFLGCFCANVSG